MSKRVFGQLINLNTNLLLVYFIPIEYVGIPKISVIRWIITLIMTYDLIRDTIIIYIPRKDSTVYGRYEMPQMWIHHGRM